jgi:hypothetical protein
LIYLAWWIHRQTRMILVSPGLVAHQTRFCPLTPLYLPGADCRYLSSLSDHFYGIYRLPVRRHNVLQVQRFKVQRSGFKQPRKPVPRGVCLHLVTNLIRSMAYGRFSRFRLILRLVSIKFNL